MNRKNDALACPCGKGVYSECCKPFHEAAADAPTAEALMRSRYSAYALGLEEYIKRTWHPSKRPAQLDLQAELEQGKWLGLAVKQHRPMGDRAEVEFVARYKPSQGPASRLHELSRFVKEDGCWYYVDGDVFSG